VRLKPIAIVVVSVTAILCFVVGDYDEADSDLSAFYSEMLSADFSGARRSIDDAIRLWPTNARYYGWRGYVASQELPSTCTHGKGQSLSAEDQEAAGEAIADYRRALGLNRRDAVAHHNLAWLEHLLGDDGAAGMDLDSAVAIDPGNAVFHLSYGMFLEEIREMQAARQEYLAAIELSPSILDSQFFIRYRTRSKGETDSLLNDLTDKLERELQHGPDPILEARLGKLYLFRGDLPRASKLLEDASRQLPNLPLVWLNLGEVYESQGQSAKALDCYQKANVIDGFMAQPFLRMGQIELQRGEKNAATNHFTEAIQRWQRITPVTAAHNNRLYVGPPQRIDDLLPTTLVWYTTPCEASEAWSGLSQIYPAKHEYAQRVHVCEELPSPHGSEELR
jgi:tetratricopeptide (TPR) repeat protein